MKHFYIHSPAAYKPFLFNGHHCNQTSYCLQKTNESSEMDIKPNNIKIQIGDIVISSRISLNDNALKDKIKKSCHLQKSDLNSSKRNLSTKSEIECEIERLTSKLLNLEIGFNGEEKEPESIESCFDSELFRNMLRRDYKNEEVDQLFACSSANTERINSFNGCPFKINRIGKMKRNFKKTRQSRQCKSPRCDLNKKSFGYLDASSQEYLMGKIKKHAFRYLDATSQDQDSLIDKIKNHGFTFMDVSSHDQESLTDKIGKMKGNFKNPHQNRQYKSPNCDENKKSFGYLNASSQESLTDKIGKMKGNFKNPHQNRQYKSPNCDENKKSFGYLNASSQESLTDKIGKAKRNLKNPHRSPHCEDKMKAFKYLDATSQDQESLISHDSNVKFDNNKFIKRDRRSRMVNNLNSPRNVAKKQNDQQNLTYSKVTLDKAEDVILKKSASTKDEHTSYLNMPVPTISKSKRIHNGKFTPKGSNTKAFKLNPSISRRLKYNKRSGRTLTKNKKLNRRSLSKNRYLSKNRPITSSDKRESNNIELNNEQKCSLESKETKQSFDDVDNLESRLRTSEGHLDDFLIYSKSFQLILDIIHSDIQELYKNRSHDYDQMTTFLNLSSSTSLNGRCNMGGEGDLSDELTKNHTYAEISLNEEEEEEISLCSFKGESFARVTSGNTFTSSSCSSLNISNLFNSRCMSDQLYKVFIIQALTNSFKTRQLRKNGFTQTPRVSDISCECLYFIE